MTDMDAEIEPNPEEESESKHEIGEKVKIVSKNPITDLSDL